MICLEIRKKSIFLKDYTKTPIMTNIINKKKKIKDMVKKRKESNFTMLTM